MKKMIKDCVYELVFKKNEHNLIPIEEIILKLQLVNDDNTDKLLFDPDYNFETDETISFEVCTFREETDEEYEERMYRERINDEKNKRYQYSQFLKLKEKIGDKTLDEYLKNG